MKKLKLTEQQLIELIEKTIKEQHPRHLDPEEEAKIKKLKAHRKEWWKLTPSERDMVTKAGYNKETWNKMLKMMIVPGKSVNEQNREDINVDKENELLLDLVLEIIGQIKQTVEATNDNQRKLDAKISEVLDIVKHRR